MKPSGSSGLPRSTGSPDGSILLFSQPRGQSVADRTWKPLVPRQRVGLRRMPETCNAVGTTDARRKGGKSSSSPNHHGIGEVPHRTRRTPCPGRSAHVLIAGECPEARFLG